MPQKTAIKVDQIIMNQSPHYLLTYMLQNVMIWLILKLYRLFEIKGGQYELRGIGMFKKTRAKINILFKNRCSSVRGVTSDE